MLQVKRLFFVFDLDRVAGMKKYISIWVFCLLITNLASAASFRILTIRSSQSTFSKQLFAGFSSSTPEKIIAFDYHGDNGRVLSKKVKEISPDLVLAIGELPIYSSVSDFPSIPFMISSFEAPSLENRSNVIMIKQAISMSQKISMLTFLFPKLKTIGTMYDPIFSKDEFESFAKAASSQGLKVLSIKVSSEKEIGSFVQGFKNKIDAFFYIADNTTGGESAQKTLYDFMNQHEIPTLSPKQEHVDHGALITLAPDPLKLGEKTWALAHSILKDGKITNRSIYLDEDEYILTVSVSKCETYGIDMKNMLDFTKQATDKGWKVYWQK